MLPLKDYNPTRTRPLVTIIIIAACAVIYFFVQPAGQRSIVRGNPQDKAVHDLQFTLDHAAIPRELTSGRRLSAQDVEGSLGRGAAGALCTSAGQDPSTVGDIAQDAAPDAACYPHKNIYLAVLYSMFLHGSLLHIGGNMLFLWIFGNNIEDRQGKVTFVIFYLLSGVVATLAQVASSPSSAVPMIGASGAIAGVMGAYLVLYPNVRIKTVFIVFILLIRDVKAKWLLLAWFVLQFFTSPSSGVAWIAHVGGFAFGVLAGLVWRTTGPRDIETGAPTPAY